MRWQNNNQIIQHLCEIISKIKLLLLPMPCLKLPTTEVYFYPMQNLELKYSSFYPLATVVDKDAIQLRESQNFNS